MPHSTQLDNERIATSTPESEAGVRVVRRDHLLVRYSHWLNVPILLGFILSGLSIFESHRNYIHQNPVERRLVEHAIAYPHSSAFPKFKLDRWPLAAEAA